MDATSPAAQQVVTQEQKLRDLETILEVSRALTAEKDLDRLLQLILTETTRVMDADRSSLFLVDERTNELFSRIAQKSEIKEFRFPIGRGIAGNVAQFKSIINIRDAYNDPRFNPAFDKKTGYKTDTILCAPLVAHEDKLVGVIQVLNKHHGIFTDYDESLITALGSHVAIALDNARLVQHFLEKQRLQQSLEIAGEIQRGLLPREAPIREGYEIAGWSQACDETGGDYFDFIDLPDQRLAIVIGDVSGHGIGPALLMATARASLRALATVYSEPHAVLTPLNNLAARDMEAGRFITLFFGALDTKGKVLQYASAGHDGPLVYRGADDKYLELDSTGFPIGIMPDVEYPDADPVPLQKGDILIFGTDGVWEAMDLAHDEYGKDRMRTVIRENREKSSQQIIDAVIEDVRAFCGEAKQRDDITMIIVKVQA